MARIRSIKPSIWSDQRFSDLSLQGRLLCLGMISNADDDGRLIASGAALIGSVFPHDDINPRAVEKWRDEIAGSGLIVVYRQGRGVYAHFPNWTKHQVIRKHMASSLPAPPDPTSAVPGAAPSDVPATAPGDAPPTTPVRTSRARGTERETETEGETGVEGPSDAPAATPDDPTAALLAEHAMAYDVIPPMSALAPVRVEIARLVAEHVPAPHIRAGLARLRERSNLHPKLLPQLVVEATNPPRANSQRSTTDDRVAQAQAATARYRDAEQRGITA